MQIPNSKTQKIPDFSFWFAPAFCFQGMTSMTDFVIEGHVV